MPLYDKAENSGEFKGYTDLLQEWKRLGGISYQAIKFCHCSSYVFIHGS